MSFDGAGTRFVSSFVIPQGVPGGTLAVTLELQPLGSYATPGEALSDLLALSKLAGKVKVPAGVEPDNVLIGAGVQDAGFWTFDQVAQTFRNWSALTPTEHSDAVYSAGELASLFRVTLLFPLYGDMSR